MLEKLEARIAALEQAARKLIEKSGPFLEDETIGFISSARPVVSAIQDIAALLKGES